MSRSQKLSAQFAQMYETHADAIFRHIYFRMGERERAKELMQESFTKVWQYLCNGNEVKNMRALLYTTATHLVADHFRKKHTSSLDELHEKGFDAVSNAHRDTIARVSALQLRGFIAELDEKYAQVVVMRYIDELQPREIAVALNESVNVISVRIHRGVQMLKSLLESKGMTF